MDEKQASSLDCWAIVEMFGHQRIAGKIKSENFGAACLIRVDVPEIETKPNRVWNQEEREYSDGASYKVAAFTKYLGIGSVYALNPVTEELAREAARQICAAPVSLFGMESIQRVSRALPASREEEYDPEDEMEDMP